MGCAPPLAIHADAGDAEDGRDHGEQDPRLYFVGEEAAQEADVLVFGTKSGRDCDKLAQTGAATTPACKIDSVLLDDAVANFECKVVGEIETGDHTIFVGEIVAAHVSEEEKRRLYNLGDFTFSGL